MCGVSGIFTLTGRPIPFDAVLRMHRALAHRGPDGEAILVLPQDSALGALLISGKKDDREVPPAWAAMAHRRLAILDLSPAGLQPMCSRSREWWVSFNGEIYNFLELKALLPGHPWRSTTDTEVLLELWERHEEQCLPLLIGMWAFVLLSPQRREAILCRDRFGIKPLYYAKTNDWLLFASEIKAIFASGLLEKRFNHDAVRQFLTYGVSVPGGNLTFYEGVFQVRPGTLLRWSREMLQEQVYYSIPEKRRLTFKQLMESVREVFLDAVRITLRSDAPLAVCLSGGIDSTSVATAAAHWLKTEGLESRIIAYTVDPAPLYESEADFAREVAERNQYHWKVVPLTSHLKMEEVVDFLLTNEEPCSLGSIVQYLLYNAISRDGIRTVLDGQGGDEAFVGYPWLYYPILQEAIRDRRFKEILPWLIKVFRNGNMDPLRIWYTGRLFFNPCLRYNREAAKLLRGQPLKPDAIPFLRILASARSWRQRQTAAIYWSELPTLLRDADRNGMRWGLEIRSPFMDHRVVELTHNADPLDLTREGWSKYPLRILMDDERMPPHIKWFKRKRGFYIQPTLFSKTLSEAIQLLLPYSRDLPEIIKADQVCRTLKVHDASSSLTWALFNLLILDASPDLITLPEEADESLRKLPPLSLGRATQRNVKKVLKLVVSYFRGEMDWFLRNLMR